ncbi:ATP-dependent RNA helicase dbp6 [Physocladia obscura]|uniref:ATP-dependent RNA helicase n=1 Tax=Physocladia obscura TaxID=109957 RepID=A0AAD5SWL2_9FUNG|nr:ATP-dependent RNA helicase dbp6 [Physocladia obscura]
MFRVERFTGNEIVETASGSYAQNRKARQESKYKTDDRSSSSRQWRNISSENYGDVSNDNNRRHNEPSDSWREKKNRKKRWAEEIEREIDAKRGSTDPQQPMLSSQNSSESQLGNKLSQSGSGTKKRSRGGRKEKVKKLKAKEEFNANWLPVAENSSRSIINDEEPAIDTYIDIGKKSDVVGIDFDLENESEEQQLESSIFPFASIITSDKEKGDEYQHRKIDEKDDSVSSDLHRPENMKNRAISKLRQPNLQSQGLPHWLANPTKIPATLATRSFESSIDNPVYNLSKHAQTRLAALNITHLFPVQQVVLPKLLISRYSSSPRTPPGDLLVSSATGSGKTLAYVLPILDYLISNPATATTGQTTATARVIPRLRALIVVPTRDLAIQVKTTLEQIAKGSTVRIGVVTGSMSFSAEQEMLIHSGGRDVGTERLAVVSSLLTEKNVMDGDDSALCSKIDILVATPGRLTDHMKGTTGFTLRHLRFLVLDEADKLLVQDYQGWLNMVLKGTKGDFLNSDESIRDEDNDGIASHSKARYDRYLASGCATRIENHVDSHENSSIGVEWRSLGFKIDQLGMPVHNIVSLRHEHIEQLNDGNPRNINGIYTIKHHTPLQKLLFSATLTRNPEKIASLQLTNPTYIAVSSSLGLPSFATDTDTKYNMDENDDSELTEDRYNAPPTLKEHMIVVNSTANKPLMLLHLLFNLRLTGILIFTRSVESAHRLAALIECVAEILAEDAEAMLVTAVTARAITSDLSTVDRKRVVTKFSKTEITALVCSDVMARGMDLGQSVKGVVNYDVPSSAGGVKTYVHRVGRTARAGREGEAWSLVEEKEARWFKKEVLELIHRANGKTVARVKVSESDISGILRTVYEKALQRLSSIVKGK